MLLLFSCTASIRTDFKVFKQQPLAIGLRNQPINGVFFLKNPVATRYCDPPFAFFLFADGSFSGFTGIGRSVIAEENFWQKPDLYLQSMKMSTGGEGHYTVTEDKSIIIETLALNPGNLVTPQRIIRFEGQLLNDSTISIHKGFCSWCAGYTYPENGVLMFDNFQYKFYKTQVRPDSASDWFWFKRKRWYKKSVWYYNN